MFTVSVVYCCCNSWVSPQASLQLHPILSCLMPVQSASIPAWRSAAACTVLLHQRVTFLSVLSCGFIPLTSSPGCWPVGCEPQMVNYVLSEPWSPPPGPSSVALYQRQPIELPPSTTGVTNRLANNDSCSCQSGWAAPSILLSAE